MSNEADAIVGAQVPVLVITGTMGSGKTTTLGEASDLLTARGMAHAAVDLDTLGMGQLSEAAWEDLTYQNLASVWPNHAAAGATRLLIADAIEHVSGLHRIREAIPDAQIIVCRLKASLATIIATASRPATKQNNASPQSHWPPLSPHRGFQPLLNLCDGRNSALYTRQLGTSYGGFGADMPTVSFPFQRIVGVG